MKIRYGSGTTKYSPGVLITLSSDELVTAIGAFLVAHKIYVTGPRTISVNNDLIKEGHIYVDPSGSVIARGKEFSGRGPDTKT